MNLEARYTSGEHLEKTPNWHAHESPWKVEHIVQMLDKHGLQPQRVCEVGCGAGDVLRLLQKRMPSSCSFWGYDISPQAIALCAGKGNERLHFELRDVRKDRQTSFDLILVLDVIEHLEDYFSFLRDIKPKSRYALLHIPLEISVQSVFIGKTFIWTRGQHGHLHYFSKETALRTVQDVGYEVLDYSYSPEFELPVVFTGVRTPGRRTGWKLRQNSEKAVLRAAPRLGRKSIGRNSIAGAGEKQRFRRGENDVARRVQF
jgi:SAM-dependent methyltransferase